MTRDVLSENKQVLKKNDKVIFKKWCFIVQIPWPLVDKRLVYEQIPWSSVDNKYDLDTPLTF